MWCNDSNCEICNALREILKYWNKNKLEKKLKCKICGEIFENLPYVKALDGNIYHPKCRGKTFKERFNQRIEGKI